MNAEEAFEIIKNFIEVRCGGNNRYAARLLEVKPQTIWNWVNGKRPNPRMETLLPVIEKIREVQDGTCSPRPHEYSVPIVGCAGAGIPDQEDFVEELEEVVVPSDYYREGSEAYRVDGDSMSPTINKGSIVGVQPTKSFAEGGIFLVALPYLGRVLKRFILKNGKPTLHSDNQLYEDIPIAVEDYSRELILGKVVWVLHKL